MRKELIRTSKFISLILRHNPGKIGLTLDKQGWASVEELIRLSTKAGRKLTHGDLKEVVETNDKQRFVFSSDGTRIRANQGHSIDIDLNLKPQVPPDTLYHGTATRNLDSIFEKGLLSGNRQHVHLSPDTETALRVGSRHGTPIVLRVNALEMYEQGSVFYRSENGVWLTESVASRYLSVV